MRVRGRRVIGVVIAVAAIATCGAGIERQTVQTTGAMTSLVGDFERVSLDGSGAQIPGSESSGASVTDDGRFVVFSSSANQYVGATGGNRQVFRKDRNTGAVLLVSATSGGGPSNGENTVPVISGDGTRVAWQSTATNIDASKDSNTAWDVWVQDLGTSGLVGTPKLVSATPGGTAGTGNSTRPSISANGDYVAFKSSDHALATIDSRIVNGVYLWEQGQPLIYISNGSLALGQTGHPYFTRSGNYLENRFLCGGDNALLIKDTVLSQQAVSADGRYVVFTGGWCGLGAFGSGRCTGTYWTVAHFKFDRVTGKVTPMVDCEVFQLAGHAYGTASSELVTAPVISSDGTTIVSPLAEGFLVHDPTFSEIGIYPVVHGNSFAQPDISSDGGVVSFISSTAVDPADTNGRPDVYVAGGAAVLLATAPESALGNGDTLDAGLDETGVNLAFASRASNLITGDTNGVGDVFLTEIPIDELGSMRDQAMLIADRAGWNDSNGLAGDPVTTSTGNFVYRLDEADSRLAPTFNSLGQWSYRPAGSTRTDVFGERWSSVLDIAVALFPDGTLRYRSDSGRIQTLPAAGTNAWNGPASSLIDSAARNAGTGLYTLVFTDGTEAKFDAAGRLVSRLDRTGAGIRIVSRSGTGVPTKVEQVHASVATEAWTLADANSDGLADHLVGPYDPTLSSAPTGTPRRDFTYTSGLLTSVSAPYLTGSSAAGAERSFTYNARNQIEKITRHRGSGLSDVVEITNTYDSFARVATQTNALGEVDRFTYRANATGPVTIVEHVGGSVDTVEMDPESVTETIEYRHDKKGRLIKAIDPYEKPAESTWNGDLPTSRTSRSGGKATSSHEPSGAATSLGLPHPTTPGSQAGAVAATYCSPTDPRPLTTTDAANVVTKYWWTTNSSTPNACDAGRAVPVRITNAYGTTKAWDTTIASVDGRVTETVEAPGADAVTTRYHWGGNRLLNAVAVYPTGTGGTALTTYYGYDAAGRQRVVRDATGAETWTIRNARGDVTSQVGPVQVTRTCAATSCTFGSTPPTGPTTSYAYDNAGTLIQITDAANKVTTIGETYSGGGGKVITTTKPQHRSSSSTLVATSTIETYDRFDRLQEVKVGDAGTSSTQSVNTFTRDALGRIATESRTLEGSSAPLVTSYAYDADGNQTVVAHGADPDDTDLHLTKKVYDLRGRLIEERGPTGDTSAPSAVSGSSPANVQTKRTWTYDDADRIVATKVGSGSEAQTTFYRYDDAGRLRFEITDRDGDSIVGSTGPTDPDDGVREYGYTAAGRLKTITEPPTDQTSFDWATGTGKRVTTITYDGAGRATSVLDALNRTTTTTYTARGEIRRRTMHGGYWNERYYDAAGRTTELRAPSPTGTGTVSTLSVYDDRGLLTERTNQHTTGASSPPKTTYSYYDDASMATAVNPLTGANATVTYYYDARGNRVGRASVTKASTSASPSTVTDTWAYDLADRVITERLAGTPADTTSTYDETTGLLDTRTLASNRIETYDWWNNGQLRSLTSTKPSDSNGPAHTYRSCTWHNTLGNETHSIRDTSGNCSAGDVTTRAWTPAGQLASITRPSTANTPSGQTETTTYTWDLGGLPRTLMYADGVKHQFVHDKLGRLAQSQIMWSGGGGFPIVGYTYDTNGNRTIENANWNESHRTWTYPANGSPHPTKFVQAVAGGNRTTDMTWHPSGDLATEATGSSTKTYTYDDARQLTGATDSTGPDYGYTYGPRGLRLSSTVDSTTTQNTYNTQGQLTTAVTGSNTRTYTWDNDGRLTGTTDPSFGNRTTRYDARGLPYESTIDPATGDDIVEARTYGDDRLLATHAITVGTNAPIELSFNWDPTRPEATPLELRLGSGVYARNNYGLETVGLKLSSSGSAVFYGFDIRHSVLETTTMVGAPTDYEPYGKPNVTLGAQLAYRTELNFLDRIHLRNRDYSPETGTFTTKDPLDGIPGTTTETNPYHYTNNNPINLTDPLGLSPSDCSGFQQGWGFLTSGKCNPLPFGAVELIPFYDCYNLVANPESRTDAFTWAGCLLDALPAGALAADVGLKSLRHADELADLGRGLDGSVIRGGTHPLSSINPSGDLVSNCGRCAVALDRTLGGYPSSALPGGPHTLDEIAEQVGKTADDWGLVRHSSTSIVQELKAAGPGSRGIVYGGRGAPGSGQIGHFFNAVNQNGVVRFLDGQSGSVVTDLSGFDWFALLRTK